MMEIRNPAKLPTNLNSAEKKFTRCLATGESCEFQKGVDNVVRSEIIRFFAYGGNEKNPVLGPDIYLQGAWIIGELNLLHASIPYVLNFSNCHFVASVVMLHTECAGLYLNGSNLVHGLFADGLTTKGDVNLRDGFSAVGEVRLSGATIGGNLDCTGGKFHNKNGYALVADKLMTKGNVNLIKGFSARGGVRLLGANIGGDLNCTGGEFRKEGGNAFFADKLVTKGDVNLIGDFCAEGAVRLLGANIGGSLNCVGGEFNNASGNAFFADRLMTKGDVNLIGGFCAKGEVRLLGANIGGSLNCTGGKFNNLGGNALSLDDMTTKGNTHLRNGFCAKGEVRLLGANIGGSLSCAGGEFHNPKRYALNINNGNISGGLLWRKATCEGDVNLGYARADVLVDDLGSWKSCKVNLDGFTYNRFANPMDVQFRIDWLAKRPDGRAFSPQPYEQEAKVLFGMGRPADARKVLLKKERLQTKDGKMHWLRKVGRRFWDVFVGYGYRLRYTMLWMLGIVVLGAGLFGFAAHHNQIVPHQPSILASEKYKKALEANPIPMKAVRIAFPGEYPEFTPLAFSLDVFIPLFALHQEPFWAPASNEDDDLWKSSILLVLLLVVLATLLALACLARECHKRIKREQKRRKESSASSLIWSGIGMAFLVFMLGIVSVVGSAHIFWDFEIVWLADWRWLTVWYWLEIIAGWGLTSLFLLSVTGLLRPRQSSSEKD